MPIFLNQTFRANIDFSEWGNYPAAIQSIINSIPALKLRFFQNVRDRYMSILRQRQLEQNINVTGTYRDSLTSSVEGAGTNNPALRIFMEPIGQNADRLSIYWRVLEFGGFPNPNVPTGALELWGFQKWGSPVSGRTVARKIASTGIDPHPILQSLFVLTPGTGDPIRLTNLAIVEAEAIAVRLMEELEVIYSTISIRGRPRLIARQPSGIPEGGQFAKLSGNFGGDR